MIYVLPAGTKVTARKSEDGHHTVRPMKLREQLTFDTCVERGTDLIFDNGAWSLTAKSKDVEVW